MSEAHAARFDRERPRLIGLAYRLLGSVVEAEEALQDAFDRFQAIALDQVADPSTSMSKIVARLCLERLKSARARRESYLGTWLPEPLIDRSTAAANPAFELSDDLSFAMLLRLEQLTPAERTSFLLHCVLRMDLEDVAEVLECSSAGCRELVDRAREHVEAGRLRFDVTAEDKARLAHAVLRASGSGDVSALVALLAADAILYVDGGGKRSRVVEPIHGAERIAGYLFGVQRQVHFKVPSATLLRRVNLLPGFVLRYDDGEIAVGLIELRDGLIHRMYLVNNPDKLRHVRA